MVDYNWCQVHIENRIRIFCFLKYVIYFIYYIFSYYRRLEDSKGSLETEQYVTGV